MPGDAASTQQLFDISGQRKYLSLDERLRFLKAAQQHDDATRLFCMVLALSGCRISEALALTPQQLDAGTNVIVFRTLKRRRLVFRAVPVPSKFMRDLVAFTWTMPREDAIWTWCRQTAWHRVKNVMDAAKIVGPQASPKGLRHGFGIAAANQNVPAALIARWLGHSSQLTTAIYLEVVGQEERQFAKRMWHDYARL